MKKSFTVNRKNWVRGSKIHIYGQSLLLNSYGNMCCVGFFAKQVLNKKDNEILNASFVTHRNGVYKISERDTKGFQKIYDLNDEISLSDNIREQELKKAFKKLGFSINFEG